MTEKATIHTYDEVYLTTVVLYADGSCTRNDTFKYHKREVINKMACYYPNCTHDIISDLVKDTDNYETIPHGAKLFVAPECKISRDTFRNSGYSLVMDRIRADAIVVPDVSAKRYSKLNCNMVVKKGNDIYLAAINKRGYGSTGITDVDLYNVRKYFESIGWIPDESQKSSIDVWFIPKCEDLQSVLEQNNLPVPYRQESLVPINPSTKISAETLVFWENIDDDNLLVRTICTSDWNDYPVTLLCFLVYFKDGDNKNWFNSANNDFRRILQSIGYQYNYRWHDWIYNNRDISQKDYEMLQSYLYYKIGLKDGGGMIDWKAFNGLDRDLRKLLQSKVALKPMKLPATMSLKNIISMNGF